MQKMKYENGVYHCPKCGSTKILELQEHTIFKLYDINAKTLCSQRRKGKPIDLKDFAYMVDNSTLNAVLSYECCDCNWTYYPWLESEVGENE